METLTFGRCTLELEATKGGFEMYVEDLDSCGSCGGSVCCSPIVKMDRDQVHELVVELATMIGQDLA